MPNRLLGVPSYPLSRWLAGSSPVRQGGPTTLHWAVTFPGRGRSEPAVTQQQILARQGLDQLGDRFSLTPSASPEQDPRPEPQTVSG